MTEWCVKRGYAIYSVAYLFCLYTDMVMCFLLFMSFGVRKKKKAEMNRGRDRVWKAEGLCYFLHAEEKSKASVEAPVR